MPTCLKPNCFYELVLLENRGKYKCAKCGKLFSQKEIETKEFQNWNKRQRQEEKERIEQEIKQNKKERPKLTKEEKLIRSRESQQKFREENRDAYNQIKREYWASNHEHLLVKRRENYNKQKAKILAQQKLYRQNHNIERKINALRWEQKELALKIFENRLNNAYNLQLQQLLPTFVLSELLENLLSPNIISRS